MLSVTVSDGSADATDSISITVSDGSLSVDAGFALVSTAGNTLSLDATVSDPAATITWSQIGGVTTALSSTSVEDPSVALPVVTATETLVYQISADNGVDPVATDQVIIDICVAADAATNKTVVSDFTGEDGWACTVAPIAASTPTTTDVGSVVTYDSNGIPDHATGTFPNSGNPNTITEQTVSYDVPAIVDLDPGTANPSGMAEFGVTVDGVKLDRDTAESYEGAGQWNYEAIVYGVFVSPHDSGNFNWLGSDCNNGHVQPTGAYHYHGLMEGILNRNGEDNDGPDDMVLGGYAADGYPFYLRYGYNDPNDATSGLQVMEHSWELKAGTRDSGPGGTYDGEFRQDWVYQAGTGETDQCGGQFGVTPEYPAGIYHYFTTDDYPFIPRCVHGTPDASFRSRAGGI